MSVKARQGKAAEGDGSWRACVASLFYIGLKYGRRFSDIGRDPADPGSAKIWQKNREPAKRIHEKFVEKYVTVVCHQVQRRLFGRACYTPDVEQYKKFLDEGGHDTVCPSVCGDAVACAVEEIGEQEGEGSGGRV